MKLVHLSDLHLGKRLHGFSMLEDQEYILRQTVGIVRDEQADAVLLSGDIYDKSVPAAEAVTLLDKFLNQLAALGVKVFAISGNHDSPERLAFGSRLMEGAGIYLSQVYDGQIQPLSLSDEFGTVNFWLLPFIKPAHVKRYYPEENIESYTDACRVAVAHMDIDPTQRNVLLTHQFVTGAQTCDSEELSVGGSDNVDASVFDIFDYVALGHIHGPQNIDSNRIRYCGTPLKYSFSEEQHKKSVTVAELGEKGRLKLTLCPLTPLRDLRTVQGTFAEVTDKSAYGGTKTDDYIQVILTDEEDIPEAMGKLRIIYPNIMHLCYDNTRTRRTQQIDCAQNVEEKTPLALFEELYEKQNNQPMSQLQRSFTEKLIMGIREGRQ